MQLLSIKKERCSQGHALQTVVLQSVPAQNSLPPRLVSVGAPDGQHVAGDLRRERVLPPIALRVAGDVGDPVVHPRQLNLREMAALIGDMIASWHDCMLT